MNIYNKLPNCLDIFIGYDSRFPEPAHVLTYSLVRNFDYNFKVHYLNLAELHKADLIWRIDIDKASTEFTYTRFLIPYIMNYQGIALFLDNDMLCLMLNHFNIKQILTEFIESDFPIACVTHNQEIKKDKKMYDCVQLSYPRKNWSSVMLLDCKKLQNWTLDYVNKTDGIKLQQFNNINTNTIFELPNYWNQLDRIEHTWGFLHYTSGGPWFKDDDYIYPENCENQIWIETFNNWLDNMIPKEYKSEFKLSRYKKEIGPIKYLDTSLA